MGESWTKEHNTVSTQIIRPVMATNNNNINSSDNLETLESNCNSGCSGSKVQEQREEKLLPNSLLHLGSRRNLISLIAACVR